MKSQNDYQSLSRFISILSLVLKRPGVRQKQIAQVTRISKGTVSRLCSQGVENNVLDRVKNGYYPGSLIKEYANAFISVETL